MKTPSSVFSLMLVAVSAVALVSRAATDTAGDVFQAHSAEIVTNQCIVVDGYVFGIGRAISRKGGDAVGFGKARLLAFGKIAGRACSGAPWPSGATEEQRRAAWRLLIAEQAFPLTLEGCETILEKREAPEHYLAVVAIPLARFAKSLPSTEALARYVSRVEESVTPADKTPMDLEPIPEYGPRGYWEESGVKINETLGDSGFL